MEHTKKFVLVDPRFVRPSMRDKALSGLDNDISNILNSDLSDEIKARNYVSALARYKNYSTPPKSVEPKPAPPPPPAAPPTTPAVSTAFTFTGKSPLKRPRKRVKTEPLDIAPSLEPKLWRRTQRSHVKKKFGSQWIEYDGRTKKPKSRATWIES